MSTQIPIPASQSTLERVLQKVMEDLKLSLRTVVSLVSVYYTTRNSQVIGVHWGGYIDLQVFIENLPKLKKESPYVYNYLTTNHKETIKDAKTLVAKLKLQELPIPRIIVEQDNSSHYPKKPSKRNIQISDDRTIWSYFYKASAGKNMVEVENQVEEYLKEVKPILVGISEMIASTAYEHLVSVAKSVRAEYT